MSTIQVSESAIEQKAWQVYQQIRSQVETPDNIGRMIIIDADSGDYEIGDDTGLDASRRLRDRRPNSQRFGIRIGYKFAASFDGELERLSE